MSTCIRSTILLQLGGGDRTQHGGARLELLLRRLKLLVLLVQLVDLLLVQRLDLPASAFPSADSAAMR